MGGKLKGQRGRMSIGRKPIVVVGSINLDLVANADRIPAVGETVHGSNFQMHPGGKGANQAVAAARLGYPVQMIGKVGSDAFGEQLRSHLESAAVGLEGVTRAEGASGVAVIVVAPHGENCIVVTSGANAQVTPEYVGQYSELIRNAALVLMQLEIPLPTVERVADLCAQHGVPLILDPAPARELPDSLLHRVSWFTPNETEAAYFGANSVNGYGQAASPSSTAQQLLVLGPRGVLLKLGPRGAYLSTGDGMTERINAIAVKAIDTTAAGDAFNGAFAVGLAHGKDPVESARFAVAAAALSVTRAGAQPSMPVLREVEELLDESGRPGIAISNS
jgi:ribokinase